MQDKTINNALLVLRKKGGTEGKLAEVLLSLRGVETPCFYQENPFKRGHTKRLALDQLREGPKTTTEIGEVIRQHLPEIGPKRAANRAYQALWRLKEQGVVRNEGRLWFIVGGRN